MSVDELTRDQMVELKQRILTDEAYERGEGVSYGELAEADSLVTDEKAKEIYAGTSFSADDFTS